MNYKKFWETLRNEVQDKTDIISLMDKIELEYLIKELNKQSCYSCEHHILSFNPNIPCECALGECKEIHIEKCHSLDDEEYCPKFALEIEKMEKIFKDNEKVVFLKKKLLEKRK